MAAAKQDGEHGSGVLRDAIAAMRDHRARDAVLDLGQLDDGPPGQRIAIELRFLLFERPNEDEAAAIGHPIVVAVAQVFGHVMHQRSGREVNEIDRAIVRIFRPVHSRGLYEHVSAVG